ncbi:hypothetical protein Pcinc_006518 [Petrolisthes cinctipes]|uniref:Uncharacterized protein n=1 Tax=Petrolisthes cinctipes TaxID=88211 RepID=A0AAE1GCV6_PETCI|nr:hypothetical protein Pcinc_006518 [Petrolisthes cinctipes]
MSTQRFIKTVRLRVYILGIISIVMALFQTGSFVAMLSLVLTPEYFDVQVGVGAGLMALLTFCYAALTARLMFLFFEKRYEETKGPEWMWWFFTVGLILFNLLLVVWFSLLNDYLPAALCCLAAPTYAVFFVYAKDDIKKLRVSEGCGLTKDVTKGG